jgi:hypothetical protein
MLLHFWGMYEMDAFFSMPCFFKKCWNLKNELLTIVRPKRLDLVFWLRLLRVPWISWTSSNTILKILTCVPRPCKILPCIVHGCRLHESVHVRMHCY